MNGKAVIPSNYAQWRHCIEIDCGLALTTEFVESRIDALSRSGSEEVRRFAALYGAEHLQSVLGWFMEARTRTMSEPLGSPR